MYDLSTTFQTVFYVSLQLLDTECGLCRDYVSSSQQNMASLLTSTGCWVTVKERLAQWLVPFNQTQTFTFYYNFFFQSKKNNKKKNTIFYFKLNLIIYLFFCLCFFHQSFTGSALAALVKGLPEALQRQYEYEDPIVRGGKQLLHSPFFKVCLLITVYPYLHHCRWGDHL